MKQRETILTKISIKGFKSIREEQSIDIRPLTILAGANSSGKSSMMQPILLLKQTIESPGDPGALKLFGENVKFSKAKQLLFHCTGKESESEFSVGMDLSPNEQIRLIFKYKKNIGFDLEKMTYTTKKKSVKIFPTMPKEEILKTIPEFQKNLFKQIYNDNKKIEWVVARERCFFSIEAKYNSGTGLRPIPFVFSPSSNFISILKDIIHLPGLRGNPQREYPKSASGPLFPGTFENYVASIIMQWQSDSNDKIEELGNALENMGLTWKVEPKRINDAQVEIKVGRLASSKRGGGKDMVSIADVGFGVSQVLPVLVALLVAKPGQVVYLEQPEIHLHPNAQRKLAELVFNAAKQGVLVIVETHSTFLLKEIQTLVASGKYDKDLVKLHWVKREGDGNTIVSSAELDENGAFGPWPADFDEVGLDAEKAYLDAVEARVSQ